MKTIEITSEHLWLILRLATEKQDEINESKVASYVSSSLIPLICKIRGELKARGEQEYA